MAIQMAKVCGAYVAVTSSARNREFVLGLGVDEVCAYDDDDSTGPIELFDLMFGTVGGTSYAYALPWMKL